MYLGLIPIEPCQSRNQQPIAENPLDAPPNVPQVPGGYDGSLDYGALFRSISPIFDLSLGLGPATSMGEMSSNSDNLDSTPACFTLSDSDQLLAQSLRNIAPQEVIPSGSLQESIDTPFDHSGSPRTTLHPPSTGSTPATETPQNIGWAAPNVTFPQPDSSSLSQDTMSQIQVDKQIPPRETMAYSGTQLASSSEEVQNTLEELPIEDAEMDQIPLRIVNKLIEDAMASQSAFNMLSELAAIRGVTNAELGHLPHGIGRIFNNTRFLEEFTALSRIMGDNPKVHTVMEKLLGGGTLSDAIFQRRLDNGKIKLLM
jgi:hypothetical protein